MQLFHLVAAWLFPCAVCATTMTTPAADEGEGGRAAEPPPSLSSPLVSAPTGDRLELGTSSSRQQRSSSASPPCFGARARRQAAARAAPNGKAAANDYPAEHHPRKSRSPPARNAIATDAPVSSASSSPKSSPPSSLRDRLRLGLTASPPRGCSASPPAHGGSAMSRSPEAEKGRAVGGYLRRISKRLTTRGATAAADEEAAPATMIPHSSPLIGEGRRKGGSAIATEEEIRAFVIANGSRAIPLV